MPRSTRDEIKMHVEAAITHLENCNIQLAKAALYYEEYHKDIYDKYCTTVAAVDCMKIVVKQLLEQV